MASGTYCVHPLDQAMALETSDAPQVSGVIKKLKPSGPLRPSVRAPRFQGSSSDPGRGNKTPRATGQGQKVEKKKS